MKCYFDPSIASKIDPVRQYDLSEKEDWNNKRRIF